MTKRQWWRMQVVALRMTRVAMHKTKRRRLRQLVADCLHRFDGNGSWVMFRNWDHSEWPNEEMRKNYSWPEVCCDEVQRWVWDMEEQGELPYYPEKEGKESAFVGPLTCCIRVGIDLACEPSAGVVGFTIGDLRAMWPKRKAIPGWISKLYERDLNAVEDGEEIWL